MIGMNELQMALVSIIIPMKDESAGIDILFDTLLKVLSGIDVKFEIIAVNDGSSDDTLEKLIEVSRKTKRIKTRIIDLSRNFGKEAAMYAGMANCSGDAAIAIDADLQEPPSLIQEMIRHWREGYEVVTAVRSSRDVDTFTKRITAKFFYDCINKMSDTKLVHNAGDYRLLNRGAIDAFIMLDERVRFNKGLLTWIGFKEKIIFYSRDSRAAGTTKWNYWKLFKFAIDGITSFSKAPLEIWFYIGALVSFMGFCYGMYYLIRTIIFGIDLPGYPSLLVLMLFFSGLQMIGIGILGHYIGRIFLESKRRPLYIIKKIY